MDKFFTIKKIFYQSFIFFFSSQKKELDSFFHFHGSYNNSDSFRPFRFKKNWSDSSHIDETERTDWFNFGHILKLHLINLFFFFFFYENGIEAKNLSIDS